MIFVSSNGGIQAILGLDATFLVEQYCISDGVLLYFMADVLE